MRIITDLEKLDSLLSLKRGNTKNVEGKVASIINDVKANGDKALADYTKKFDKARIAPKDIQVKETEISSAFNSLNSSLVRSLKKAMDNVTKFYKATLPKGIRIKEPSGKSLSTYYAPVDRVGIYVPAGQFPLVSTVYMTAIPAIVAGVKDIVMVSPPNEQGAINPHILAVASLLKIKEIYKAGGAQAIAALAYGTKTVKRVNMIVGPGNEYVTEAKRQVSGQVGIDMLAGPSEVVIIASKDSSPDLILADLLAQTEHRGGLGIVITNSKKIANFLRATKLNGLVIRVRNMMEACEVANRIAPEHLQIMTKKANELVYKINNAGAIFVGENSPVALGDYIAGPSHVLPTNTSAKFYSGLGVHNFLKEIHVINYSKKALADEFDNFRDIVSLEGMEKHLASVEARIKKERKS